MEVRPPFLKRKAEAWVVAAACADCREEAEREATLVGSSRRPADAREGSSLVGLVMLFFQLKATFGRNVF